MTGVSERRLLAYGDADIPGMDGKKFADNIRNDASDMSALVELCKLNQGKLTDRYRGNYYADMTKEKYFWTGMPGGWYLARNGPAGVAGGAQGLRIYAWHPNSKAKSPPPVGWVAPAGVTLNNAVESGQNKNNKQNDLLGNVTGTQSNAEGIEAVRKMVNTAASGGVAAYAPDCHLRIRRCTKWEGGESNKVWLAVSGFREAELFNGAYAIHDIEHPKDWGRGTANLFERDGYTKTLMT